LQQLRLEEKGLMRRAHMGYALLALSLLVVPACGGPDTGAATDGVTRVVNTLIVVPPR